mmetsp:Transcript_36103/g.72417  ORF Transcript_36103/g.72417 Transcript_36103/m.72417 type:complete len:303 (-) Transcript_36103:2271-3179(-)
MLSGSHGSADDCVMPLMQKDAAQMSIGQASPAPAPTTSKSSLPIGTVVMSGSMSTPMRRSLGSSSGCDSVMATMSPLSQTASILEALTRTSAQSCGRTGFATMKATTMSSPSQPSSLATTSVSAFSQLFQVPWSSVPSRLMKLEALGPCSIMSPSSAIAPSMLWMAISVPTSRKVLVAIVTVMILLKSPCAPGYGELCPMSLTRKARCRTRKGSRSPAAVPGRLGTSDTVSIVCTRSPCTDDETLTALAACSSIPLRTVKHISKRSQASRRSSKVTVNIPVPLSHMSVLSMRHMVSASSKST